MSARANKTVNVARLPVVERHRTRVELRVLEGELADVYATRPRTRGDCERGPRPCPWIACKHHLYLDVKPNGSMRLNFPDIEPGDMRESCALDLADQGGATLEVIANSLNVSKEMIRLIEAKVLAKLEHKPAVRAILEAMRDA